MRIRAVAFDVDGTLYPNSMMYRLSAGFFVRYPRFVYHYSRVRREIRRQAEIADFRRRQAELLAPRLRVTVDRAYALIEKRIYHEWIESFRSIRPFPHVRATLDALRESGLVLAALSDYPPDKKVAYLGLASAFSCILSSEDSGYLKPHGEPFALICDCLSLPPEEILYVGDIYAYDIVGAKKAGLRAAYLQGRRRERESGPEPDIVFSGYQEFPSALDSWLEGTASG